MTTRPTDTPVWATVPSGGSSVVEPPSSKQLQGWVFQEFPPAQFVNWAWNRFADWSAHLASTNSTFPTMQAAIRAPAAAPLVVGDSCLVDETETVGPGVDAIADIFPTIGTIRTVDACGDFVAAAHDDGGGNLEITLAERDGSGVIRTFSPTLVGVIGSCDKILTDGVDVIIFYTVTAGSVVTVECFTAATGVSKWINNTAMVAGGALISDIDWDQDHVYIVSDDAGRELIALNRSTGVLVYAYDHSGVATAPLHSVAANGLLVFVSGAASGSASAANLRGILALTGADAAGEGGLGTSAIAWDAVMTTASADGDLLATDGVRLFCGSGNDLEQRGAADGVLAGSTFTFTLGAATTFVTIDQDYVYFGGSLGGAAFEKNRHSMVWFNASGFGADRLVSDGTAVFTDRKRIARGNFGQIRFKRIDPATAVRPSLRQVLSPIDIA